MFEAFHAKLAFALKALALSRGALAAELGVDKSLVGRWVSGAVRPSAHNLTRLSELVAGRVPGFTALDWERPLAKLALVLGVDPETAAGMASGPADLLTLPLLDHSQQVTALRGGAYEGFFRTTRPYAQSYGRFMHDQIMIRRQASGMLGFRMASSGVAVEGRVLLLQNQLFVVSAEMTSGAYAFAILNGVSTIQAGRLDGLMLYCSMDTSRTPTASPILLDRIGDLSGDVAADDARFAELALAEALAPEGSVPAEIAAHLVRDIGPAQADVGGDWLLRLTAARSLSRGLGTPH